MFPYIIIWGLKVYMTGVGIVISFITFLLTGIYFCKKYKQSFWQFFYRAPLFVMLLYLLGTYVTFVMQVSLIPTSYDQFMMWLSPYGFPFHFVWLLIATTISIAIFIKKIKRYENKKVWIDILFFSISISLIPLGFFLLLWDNFIGKPTDSWLWIRALHPDSQLNKFSTVFPIWLLLSLFSLAVTILLWIIRRIKKKYGLWLIWFIILLLGINIILLLQQYPRYGVVSIGQILLDIKQHLSFLIIMYCLWVYYKWKKIS